MQIQFAQNGNALIPENWRDLLSEFFDDDSCGLGGRILQMYEDKSNGELDDRIESYNTFISNRGTDPCPFLPMAYYILNENINWDTLQSALTRWGVHYQVYNEEQGEIDTRFSMWLENKYDEHTRQTKEITEEDKMGKALIDYSFADVERLGMSVFNHESVPVEDRDAYRVATAYAIGIIKAAKPLLMSESFYNVLGKGSNRGIVTELIDIRKRIFEFVPANAPVHDTSFLESKRVDLMSISKLSKIKSLEENIRRCGDDVRAYEHSIRSTLATIKQYNGELHVLRTTDDGSRTTYHSMMDLASYNDHRIESITFLSTLNSSEKYIARVMFKDLVCRHMNMAVNLGGVCLDIVINSSGSPSARINKIQSKNYYSNPFASNVVPFTSTSDKSAICFGDDASRATQLLLDGDYCGYVGMFISMIENYNPDGNPYVALDAMYAKDIIFGFTRREKYSGSVSVNRNAILTSAKYDNLLYDKVKSDGVEYRDVVLKILEESGYGTTNKDTIIDL